MLFYKILNYLINDNPFYNLAVKKSYFFYISRPWEPKKNYSNFTYDNLFYIRVKSSDNV